MNFVAAPSGWVVEWPERVGGRRHSVPLLGYSADSEGYLAYVVHCCGTRPRMLDEKHISEKHYWDGSCIEVYQRGKA